MHSWGKYALEAPTRMLLRDLFLIEAQRRSAALPAGVDDDAINEAAWWLERWVSGSANDPEWDDSWCKMTMPQAFALISRLVGNKVGASRANLWRALSVPKKVAAKIAAEKLLPPNPKFPYQSFSGKRAEALAMVDYTPKGHVWILVQMAPDPTRIAFSMADVKRSRYPKLSLAYDHLGDWHHQDEVMVLVDRPLPLLSVEVLDKGSAP